MTTPINSFRDYYSNLRKDLKRETHTLDRDAILKKTIKNLSTLCMDTLAKDNRSGVVKTLHFDKNGEISTTNKGEKSAFRAFIDITGDLTGVDTDWGNLIPFTSYIKDYVKREDLSSKELEQIQLLVKTTIENLEKILKASDPEDQKDKGRISIINTILGKLIKTSEVLEKRLEPNKGQATPLGKHIDLKTINDRKDYYQKVTKLYSDYLLPKEYAEIKKADAKKSGATESSFDDFKARRKLEVDKIELLNFATRREILENLNNILDSDNLETEPLKSFQTLINTSQSLTKRADKLLFLANLFMSNTTENDAKHLLEEINKINNSSLSNTEKKDLEIFTFLGNEKCSVATQIKMDRKAAKEKVHVYEPSQGYKDVAKGFFSLIAGAGLGKLSEQAPIDALSQKSQYLIAEGLERINNLVRREEGRKNTAATGRAANLFREIMAPEKTTPLKKGEKQTEIIREQKKSIELTEKEKGLDSFYGPPPPYSPRKSPIEGLPPISTGGDYNSGDAL